MLFAVETTPLTTAKTNDMNPKLDMAGGAGVHSSEVAGGRKITGASVVLGFVYLALLSYIADIVVPLVFLLNLIPFYSV